MMRGMQNREALNNPDNTQLTTALKTIGFGDLLTANVNAHLRKQAPLVNTGLASPENLSTEDVIVLPDQAKASRILRCTVRAGSVTGEFTEKAGFGTTPTTGTVAVTPSGDLAFLHTDLVTNADVSYVPERGDVFTWTLSVNPSTGVCALPVTFAARGVILLLQANVQAGTIIGRMNVVVPSATNPTSTKACLNVAKTQVLFATADAVTRATIKVLVAPAIDSQAALLSEAVL